MIVALWAHADYDSYTGQEKLTKLQAHMAEVRQRLLGSSSRDKSVTGLPPNYLADLKVEEKELIAQLRTGGRMVSNNVEFGID